MSTIELEPLELWRLWHLQAELAAAKAAERAEAVYAETLGVSAYAPQAAGLHVAEDFYDLRQRLAAAQGSSSVLGPDDMRLLMAALAIAEVMAGVAPQVIGQLRRGEP